MKVYEIITESSEYKTKQCETNIFLLDAVSGILVNELSFRKDAEKNILLQCLKNFLTK